MAQIYEKKTIYQIFFDKNVSNAVLIINHNYALSSMRKVVPLPISELLTYIFPLWYSSTIRFANERPKPHPLDLVVKPGLNTV